MATHSIILPWEIPWTEDPAGLYSPWGHPVGRNLVTENNNKSILLLFIQNSVVFVY